jgi:hypothetical protein
MFGGLSRTGEFCVCRSPLFTEDGTGQVVELIFVNFGVGAAEPKVPIQ